MFATNGHYPLILKFLILKLVFRFPTVKEPANKSLLPRVGKTVPVIGAERDVKTAANGAFFDLHLT